MTKPQKSYESVTFGTLEMQEALTAATHGRTPLDRLEQLVRLRRLLSMEIAQEARMGFDRGATWSEVGATLGVSRQAAWEAYGAPKDRAAGRPGGA